MRPSGVTIVVSLICYLVFLAFFQCIPDDPFAEAYLYLQGAVAASFAALTALVFLAILSRLEFLDREAKTTGQKIAEFRETNGAPLKKAFRKTARQGQVQARERLSTAARLPVCLLLCTILFALVSMPAHKTAYPRYLAAAGLSLGVLSVLELLSMWHEVGKWWSDDFLPDDTAKSSAGKQQTTPR